MLHRATAGRFTVPWLGLWPLGGRRSIITSMGDAQMELITKLAREKQTSINLEQLYSFGLAASQENEQQAKDVVLQAAQFLQKELPKR